MERTTSTWIVRVWLPDRPGALGQVASRIGAVRGDVVGIDILERGAGRAIDELAVELPDDELVPLLVQEIGQVDGVDVEDVRPAVDALHDPRLDALETAAQLVGRHQHRRAARRALRARRPHRRGRVGGGRRHRGRRGARIRRSGAGAAGGVAVGVRRRQPASSRRRWRAPTADLTTWCGHRCPAPALALVLGRNGTAFRARERRQAAALARIVDTRFRELAAAASRAVHPAGSGAQPLSR